MTKMDDFEPKRDLNSPDQVWVSSHNYPEMLHMVAEILLQSF
jgi:hypothetical protein